jgi:hypothetical protein
MAIVMEANYSKKLGLSGYSSHQYSVTLRTELADLSQVDAESARLHTLLQTSVDREIQKVGFLPVKENGNGNGNGRFAPPSNGDRRREAWACSGKQRKLLFRIISEQRLGLPAVEQLSLNRFGKPVRALSKLEASALIEELKEQNHNRHSRLANPCLQPAGTQ